MITTPDTSERTDYTRLARTLWIFWAQGEDHAPFLVKQCISSWRILNPGWDIRVLDQASLRQVIDLEGLEKRRDIPLQALSDIIRVKLLTVHGGVWADASLYCAHPLDAWLPRHYQDHFFAFASERRDRVMTTWFLAGNAESPLLRQWTADMIGFWHANRFRGNTYWGRQLIRKLMSLRKRHIVSNDIWFSRFVLKILRLFPYPINMYLFERMLDRNPPLKALWKNRTHLYDTPAEYLQNRLGMNAAVNDAAKTFIAGHATPVHKLNWRQDKGAAAQGSNLEFLLSSSRPGKEY
ncbi:MAG: hypothetical protein IPM20_11070 [Gammaproteobacteria bacterium]|nr:hypothetical protein [Gammaproteobacteria bacterium]